MNQEPKLPLNNLGLYRLKNFVGRTRELELLRKWLNRYPVVAITGPSGAGKSTLATALAVEEAASFEEGILWISATGDTAFNFYDIVRAIEYVLATGITNQPVSTWPLRVLQQLYGSSRLVIMDELADAGADAVENIINMIGQIGPGGRGRFILMGRTIPQPLVSLVGEAHLQLGGLEVADVAAWIDKHRHAYPLAPSDAALLHHLSGGHPLALKMVASLWHNPDWGQLIDLISVQSPSNWESRLKATVTAALTYLKKRHPHAGHLLTLCCLASGGFSTDAAAQLYWRNGSPEYASLDAVAQTLLQLGVLMFNPQQDRYFIHPLLRRYLSVAGYAGFTPPQQHQYALDHARYYLTVAQRYLRTPLEQWPAIDSDWGNIRKALGFLANTLESALNLPLDQALQAIDLPPLPPQLDETLILIRDYVLALGNYFLWRHPPKGRRWASAGIIAARTLIDRPAEASIGLTLAGLAYFHHDYPTAQFWYRRSLAFFRDAKDPAGIVQTMQNLGVVAKAAGNFDQALNLFTQAVNLAAENNLYLEVMALYALIASIHYSQKEYRSAIRWHRKALALNQPQYNQTWRAVHHNNAGLALEANGDYEEAIKHYQKAIALHNAVDNKKGLSTTYGNLGAACYQHGRFKEALEWYGRDMAIRDSLGNWLDLAAILHNMGHIALELDDLPAAAGYFTRSRDLYRQFGQKELAEEEQILINTLKDRHVTLR